MRDWIHGIFAASLLCAVAMALCPPGRVRRVTRLVCGLACALAIAQPIMALDPAALSVGLAEYRRQAQILRESGEEEEKMLERTYIEDQCSAYILDKAEEIGVSLAGASVEARWDDEALLWYPWSVTLDGAYTAPLSRAIEGELGIPLSRQNWSDDG